MRLLKLLIVVCCVSTVFCMVLNIFAEDKTNETDKTADNKILHIEGFTYDKINEKGFKEYIYDKIKSKFVLLEKEDQEERTLLISKNKITVKIWNAVFKIDSSKLKEEDLNKPIIGISWEKAQEFCKLTNLEIPNENEWVDACRGKAYSVCYWKPYKAEDYIWFKKNSGMQLHPTGQKPSNCYGLYDMMGNATEMCSIKGTTGEFAAKFNQYDKDYTVLGCAYDSPDPKEFINYDVYEDFQNSYGYKNPGFRCVFYLDDE